MKVLLITKDSYHKWYSHLTGCIVPLLKNEYIDEYKSVQAEGYVNFVSKEDAKIIEIGVGPAFYAPYIQNDK